MERDRENRERGRQHERRADAFDDGFADHERIARHLPRVLADDGVLVYETGAKIEPEIEGLSVRTSRKYGAARLTLFEH